LQFSVSVATSTAVSALALVFTSLLLHILL
jgi:hypothetical protein